ncbi:MAG: matrixin family metalloprotease [Pikeienuella sp.]|uniref:matrixin family metalloprotease n=1 Tax=Pikeienuella sp. TaxID=2831957 RepID=UPI0039187523
MPVLFGAKWGASQFNGTPGGVVTWSIVAGGRSGVSTAYGTSRSDFTTAPEALASYDVTSVLRASFDAWTEIADIEFVQIRDDGSPVGQGSGADIRIAFGEIDGVFGDTLAQAFFPFDQNNPLAGDILVDSDERQFFSDPTQLLGVVTHEIGHSIGLEHISGVRALMNPRINDIFEPVADDIEGAQIIYGPQDDAPVEIGVGADGDLFVESGPEGLRMMGDARSNEMVGAAGGELVKGMAGDDLLRGRAGDDTLKGGGGQDALRGGAGDDTLAGLAGDDTLGGARGADVARGGGGDDFLRGGGGQDRLVGGAGADTLIGGSGRDILAGGPGADTFVFGEGAGRDRVRDFAPGQDLLDWSGNAGVASLADLSISDGADGAVVSDGAGSTVILLGVSAAALSEADFLF